MRANIGVNHVSRRKDTMFATPMENNQPARSAKFRSHGRRAGNSTPQAWNKFGDEVGGKLRHASDPGVR